LLETGPDQAVAVASTVSTDDHIQLANKFNDLSKKYQDLSQKIKYLERKNTAVMQKNKDMKESVRAWQEYADRQSGRQRSSLTIHLDSPQSLR
jgi:FtsZ-binding cell division protein ZapB